jgi:hypothetical protein
MGGVLWLLGGRGCPSKPHGITGLPTSSAQIKNKWGGKCNHTSIAAHFDMADYFVVWNIVKRLSNHKRVHCFVWPVMLLILSSLPNIKLNIVVHVRTSKWRKVRLKLLIFCWYELNRWNFILWALKYSFRLHSWHASQWSCRYHSVRKITITPWRRKRQGPPKRFYPTTSLHGVRTHNTMTWAFVAVKTSVLAWLHHCNLRNKELLFCFDATEYFWIRKQPPPTLRLGQKRTRSVGVYIIFEHHKVRH